MWQRALENSRSAHLTPHMSDSDAPLPSRPPRAPAADDDDNAPLAAAPLPLAADGRVKDKELKRLQKAYKRRGE